MNIINRTASLFGLSVSSLAVFPGLDAMRQALPMVHAFMVMGVVTLLPIIIILSAYSLRAVVTLSIVYFALLTTPFWWEFARWLDSALLDALYDSPSHNMINPYFFENTQDDIVVSFVMGSMFLILPAIWFTAMSWAGFRIGDLATHLTKGSQSAQQSSNAIPKPKA